MGKRQIRIFRNDLPNHTLELLQQPAVQLITRAKTVLTGKLKALDSESIQLQDMRAHIHTFAVGEVEEIIYDVEAAW